MIDQIVPIKKRRHLEKKLTITEELLKLIQNKNEMFKRFKNWRDNVALNKAYPKSFVETVQPLPIEHIGKAKSMGVKVAFY